MQRNENHPLSLYPSPTRGEGSGCRRGGIPCHSREDGNFAGQALPPVAQRRAGAVIPAHAGIQRPIHIIFFAIVALSGTKSTTP